MAEKVPRLMPGVDVRKFKLDPMDGFLMTRIDGKLAARDLARETGLPDFSVVRTLEKLERLGIIEIADPSAPPPAPPPPVERKSTIATFETNLLAAKYDPAELDAPGDLTPEQKKRVLDFYYRLDDLDHYTLLGITHEAEKKAVKRAYFELAAAFHPDRYFKKDLGSFKPKMEALFHRITEAHDTLVDASRRADYDGYLAEVATTRGMEAMLERAMIESAAASEAATAAAASGPAAPGSAPPAISSIPPSARPGASAEDLQRRREALARRLTGGPRPAPPTAPSGPPPAPLQHTTTQDAMDALKRRYEERIDSATHAHARKYLKEAEIALTKNDLVGAAATLAIATKYAPDDASLAARAREVKVLADASLAESYLKQAEYEERQARWSEAGRSWSKVAQIRDDAVSHERAANAWSRAEEPDLRRAADHAKRAITLEPGKIEHHITLVEVYLKAGLTSSARRSAEAATMIDAKHAGLQALLKRIGKG